MTLTLLPTPDPINDSRKTFMQEIGVRAQRQGYDFQRYCEVAVRLLQRAQERCESPIEQLLAVALLRESINDVAHMSDITTLADSAWGNYLRDEPVVGKCLIAIQAEIAEFRVDFCLNFGGGVRLVIECDGHDWHERTREQARRDRARDRTLQRTGFIVLRFTGSEIWQASMECAREIFQTAEMELEYRAAFKAASVREVFAVSLDDTL